MDICAVVCMVNEHFLNFVCLSAFEKTKTHVWRCSSYFLGEFMRDLALNASFRHLAACFWKVWHWALALALSGGFTRRWALSVGLLALDGGFYKANGT